MTAITLHQMAALETQPLRKYVIDNLVDNSPLYERIPFENVTSLRQSAPFRVSLPRPTFRHVNQAGSEISSNYDQIERALSIMDNDIKIDPVAEMQKNNIVNPRQQQVDDALQAYAYELVDKYINGSVNADDREWDGLREQYQSNALFNGQTVNASADANEFQLVPGTATDANWNRFIYLLTLTIARVNPVLRPQKAKVTSFDGSSMAWITNQFAILAIAAGLRQIKQYNVNADQFERMLPMFNDVPFIDTGFKVEGAINGTVPAAGAQGNFVIGYDSESVSTTNGGNAYTNQTPIYLQHFGPQHNMGLQMESLFTKDHGEEKSSPHYHIIQVRWTLNPAAMWQKRSGARLVGCNFSGTVS